jgi:hypothetical protein
MELIRRKLNNYNNLLKKLKNKKCNNSIGLMRENRWKIRKMKIKRLTMNNNNNNNSIIEAFERILSEKR